MPKLNYPLVNTDLAQFKKDIQVILDTPTEDKSALLQTTLQTILNEKKMSAHVEHNIHSLIELVELLAINGSEVNVKPYPLIIHVALLTYKIKSKDIQISFWTSIINNDKIMDRVDFSVCDKNNNLVFDYLRQPRINNIFTTLNPFSKKLVTYFINKKIHFPVAHYASKVSAFLSNNILDFIEELYEQSPYFQHKYSAIKIAFPASHQDHTFNLARFINSSIYDYFSTWSEEKISKSDRPLALTILRECLDTITKENNIEKINSLDTFQEYEEFDHGALWELAINSKLAGKPKFFNMFYLNLKIYFATYSPLQNAKRQNEMLAYIKNSPQGEYDFLQLISLFLQFIKNDNAISKINMDFLNILMKLPEPYLSTMQFINNYLYLLNYNVEKKTLLNTPKISYIHTNNAFIEFCKLTIFLDKNIHDYDAIKFFNNNRDNLAQKHTKSITSIEPHSPFATPEANTLFAQLKISMIETLNKEVIRSRVALIPPALKEIFDAEITKLNSILFPTTQSSEPPYEDRNEIEEKKVTPVTPLEKNKMAENSEATTADDISINYPELSQVDFFKIGVYSSAELEIRSLFDWLILEPCPKEPAPLKPTPITRTSKRNTWRVHSDIFAKTPDRYDSNKPQSYNKELSQKHVRSLSR